jgi:two-component system response regulator HydG
VSRKSLARQAIALSPPNTCRTFPTPPVNELEFLRNVCEVACQRDPEALLGRALDAAIELSGAEGGHLVIKADDAFRVALSRGRTHEPAISGGILQRVLSEGRPIRLENALEQAEFRHLESVRRLHILSVLAVPVLHEGATLGALYLVSTKVAAIFSEESARTIATFAERIGPPLAASLETQRLRDQRAELEARLASLGEAGAGLVGASPAFAAALTQLERVAPTNVPILIQGESGTGKELFARALHRLSARASKPWVALNCGALPESLLESELFGHVKGAFTGALARAGRFAAADGGTIFLDELGELPLACQVRLLRVLQEGEIQRVGSDRPHSVDVRVVAATNRDPKAQIASGEFREDLYYRLAAVTLEVPPLRAREGDVRLLTEHFLSRHSAALGRADVRLTPHAHEALAAYPWPGNVRELENVIRRALIFARTNLVDVDDLPAELRGEPTSAPTSPGSPTTRGDLQAAKRAATARIEKAFVEGILRESEGNVAEAARKADFNRSSLHELIKKHGLDAHSFRGT